MLHLVDSNHRQHHPVGSAAAFRPQAMQYALHPLERTLAGLVITLLIFMPWALGGMKLWAQWIAFGLAAATFVVALIPRNYDNRYHADGNLRLYMWPKLLRFPIFWLFLAYALIIVLQLLNPAWTYRTSSAGWWLERRDYISWLPHGIEETPFEKMNAWRTLLLQGEAWLVVCALWVGITRRRTAHLIVSAVTINGIVLAIAVMMQRMTHSEKLLWLWDPLAEYFAASFIYKNHAGEFLCLILALCVGLAWWRTRHAEQQLEKSHPGLVWFLGAILVFVGQIFTFARAASAVGAAFLLVAFVVFAVRLFFRTRGGPPAIVTAATALLSLGLLIAAFTLMDSGLVVEKFERLFTQDQFTSVGMRRSATNATLAMAEDDLILGHGAGGFRYLFPLYQQYHPDIWKSQRWDAAKNEYVPDRRLYWEYAHNDYAQLLAEMGLLGAGLASLALLLVLGAGWQANLVQQFGHFLMLCGPVLVAATAAVDFPFHNPAILLTTTAICALVLRWAQLSRRA